MNLMPDGRREQIVEALRASGMLRATDLADRLGVAAVTIRRDLSQLTDEGIVRRVYGGAVLADAQAPAQPWEPQPAWPIGMLVPSLEYYWPEVVQGARAHAESQGVRLVLRGGTYDSTDDRAQVERLLSDGAGGLILAPDTANPCTAHLLAWLDDAGVPVVLVERTAALPGSRAPVESVNTDHAEGARAAVHHLAGLSHTRIGFLVSCRSPHVEEIRMGWDAALAARRLGGRRVFELFGDSAEAVGDRAAIDAVISEARGLGITAMLVHADREAMTLAQCAQQQGLSIPGDLSIIAYDDEVAGLFTPPLTAIRPPRTSIGAAAVQLLLERRRDPERPVRRVLVAPKLNVRDSTGPAAGA